MKTISVCIPCFNEEKNLIPLYEGLVNEANRWSKYRFEFVFSDNNSSDKSVDILKKLAAKDERITLLVNTKNFGPNRNCCNALFLAKGDAMITFPADMQIPFSIIGKYIKEWENGISVVLATIKDSEENKIMFFVRGLYYRILNLFLDNPVMLHVTGGGLFDRSIIDLIKSLQEPDPDFRFLLNELGIHYKLLYYNQEKRKEGHSSYNLNRYFDEAINSLTENSKKVLRIMTLIGFICTFISGLYMISLIFFKIFNYDIILKDKILFSIIFFLISMQLFFSGLLGEYLYIIIKRVKKRPLAVIQEELKSYERYENQ